MDIPPVTEIMIIDGADNEASWSDPVECELAGYVINTVITAWDGPDDHSCKFRAAWSHSYLYLYLEITDDIEHTWNGTDGNNWEFDNVLVSFQLDTNTVMTSYNTTSVQVRYCRGETGWLAYHGRAEAEEFEVYSTNTENGWLLETAIPWTCALAEEDAPENIIKYLPVIGFDIWSTDSDNSDGNITMGNMESMFVWDNDDQGEPRDDMEWPYLFNNTAVFGYVNLIGIPVSTEKLTKEGIRSSIIYPNPAGDILHLSNYKDFFQIKIYSMEGILVLNEKLSDLSVDISELNCGMYIAVIDNIETCRFIKK